MANRSSEKVAKVASRKKKNDKTSKFASFEAEAFSDGRHVVFLKFNLIILILISRTFKRVQLNQRENIYEQ